MSKIIISGVEIADLQILVGDYADMPDLKVSDDAVRAAESVARGMANHPDRMEILPPCHSLALDPEGFDGSDECQACLEKLTCVVSLHRVGVYRPEIITSTNSWEPLSPEDASMTVPLHMPVRQALVTDLGAYTDREVRAKATALGIESHGATREALEREMASEFGSVEVVAPLEPVETEFDPLSNWKTLYHKRKGRIITCRVTKKSSGDEYEVGGKKYSTLREAAVAGFRELEGREPKRINPEKFWSEKS